MSHSQRRARVSFVFSLLGLLFCSQATATVWTQEASGVIASLRAVSAFSENQIIVVGADTTILTFDGSSWTSATSAQQVWKDASTFDSFLQAVEIVDADNVWIGSYDDPWGVSHWDGASWSNIENAGPNNDRVARLWSVGTNLVLTGRSNGRITLFDGTGWTRVVDRPIGVFFGLDGSSANDIWAASTHGEVLRSTDGGLTWALQTLPTSLTGRTWRSVSAVAPSAVWFVGDGGTIMFWDGTSFVEQDAGITADLRGVMARAPDDVFAVGAGGTVLHYDGREWSSVELGFAVTDTLMAIDMTPEGTIFIVGDNGTVIRGDRLTFHPQDGLPIRIGMRTIATGPIQTPYTSNDDTTHTAFDRLTRVDEKERREFARLGDRLEHTFCFHLPTGGLWTYELFLPLDAGAEVHVTYRSYHEAPTTDTKMIGVDGGKFSSVRFLRVDDLAGGYALDMDPEGVWQDFTNFDKQIRNGEVEIQPNGVAVRFWFSKNRWGSGRIRGKLVFYDQPVTYDTIHPVQRSGHKVPLFTTYFLDFTSQPYTNVFFIDGAMKPTGVGSDAYSPAIGYGWVDPQSPVTITDDPLGGSIHDGFATSFGNATFRLDCPPGDYLLTVTAGDRYNAIPEMTVSANDGPPTVLTNIPAGEFHTAALMIPRADDGHVSLHLAGGSSGGSWKLNALILQPLMLAPQDYRDRQSWWRHTGWPGEAASPQ